MMEGFGVHTFRMIDEKGTKPLCQVSLKRDACAASILWDEAVKISGKDADFHRRDLFEGNRMRRLP